MTISNVKVSKNLEQNIKWLKEKLGVGKSFDVVCREITFAGKNGALFFVDGFAKDEIMLYIMQRLTSINKDDLIINPLPKLVKQYVNYIEVTTSDDLNDVVDKILSGPVALIVENVSEAIIIDAREYPVRSPQEPDLERVVRGSRDGFVETIVFNTSLIRRRIRDPKLRTVLVQAGQRSKTDICIVYIEDIANPELVNQVKSSIENIKVDGLPMAEKSVEEFISPNSIWNPYPTVRYTERADVAAVHLLEGHVLVIVDTSPSVMILPATFFHHLQHAEEFRQSPPIGFFQRWVRYLGIVLALLGIPLYLLFTIEPQLLPKSLSFLGPTKVGRIPLMWQFLIGEFGINLMRMAAIHTPSSLATALGLIAAVLIGQVAIDIGLFAPETVLYFSVAAVGTFATPSFELGMANTLTRIILILTTGIFGLTGFIVSTLIVIIFLAKTKSFGIPYLWPFLPFNLSAIKSILLRPPVPIQNTRPSFLKPIDRSRQPTPALKRLNKKTNK
ncbi:MAG: spore germination protein [Zhaonellaceae bacterium]|jgi:stage V sporulation protein AF|nr:spore germination protein [Clostridia bacterium]